MFNSINPQMWQSHAVRHGCRANMRAVQQLFFNFIDGMRHPTREPVRYLPHDLLELSGAVQIDDQTSRRDLFKGVFVAQSLFLQDAPQFGIQSGVSPLSPAFKHVINRTIAGDFVSGKFEVPNRSYQDQRDRK